MHIVLVPGLWLDGDSWAEVTPVLEEAGHVTHPVTLPGLESRDADRSGITLRDHVDAVTDNVDAIGEPIVLVGHSAGGAIAHAVVDARPDRIVRMVYVDSGPVGDGGRIADDLPTVDGDVPFPDWSAFGDQELADLDDAGRSRLRERAIPSPAGVVGARQVLRDDRRYEVPVTVITSSWPAPLMQKFIDEGHPALAELTRIRDYEIVELPTGHWPQFTRPTDLGRAILAAVDR